MENTLKKRGRPMAQINWPNTMQFTIAEVADVNQVSRACVVKRVEREVKLGNLKKLPREQKTGKKPSFVYVKSN